MIIASASQFHVYLPWGQCPLLGPSPWLRAFVWTFVWSSCLHLLVSCSRWNWGHELRQERWLAPPAKWVYLKLYLENLTLVSIFNQVTLRNMENTSKAFKSFLFPFKPKFRLFPQLNWQAAADSCWAGLGGNLESRRTKSTGPGPGYARNLTADGRLESSTSRTFLLMQSFQ